MSQVGNRLYLEVAITEIHGRTNHWGDVLDALTSSVKLPTTAVKGKDW